MTWTVGLLYAETEQRLCVSYRFDEQLWTGRALVAAGAALVVALVAVPLGPSSSHDERPGQRRARQTVES